MANNSDTGGYTFATKPEDSLAPYVLSKADQDYLNRTFTYQPPHGTQPDRYVHLRALALSLAEQILANCPSSRERSLALTKLEESVMWANAAIARNE